MTREQAKQKLIAMGIEEPTKEQISELLNTINEATRTLEEKADKADELQKQLDDINAQNLTESEKLANDLKKANEKIAEMEKSNTIRDRRASAMEKFKITSEQANQVVKDDGEFDMEVLGQIITDKEKASATAKEQEIAKGSSNPNGVNSGNGAKELTKAEELVMKFMPKPEVDNDILKHYI